MFNEIVADDGGNITIDGGSGDNYVSTLAGFENLLNIQSPTSTNPNRTPDNAQVIKNSDKESATTQANGADAEAEIIENIFAQRRYEAEFVEKLEERRRDEAEYVDRLNEQRAEQSLYARGRRNGRNVYVSHIAPSVRELGLV